MTATCVPDTVYWSSVSSICSIRIFFFQITLFSTWVRLVRRHLLCQCTTTTSQTWLQSSVSTQWWYTPACLAKGELQSLRMYILQKNPYTCITQRFLHTSRISHLLLYPSLRLLVLRLSSHFRYCSRLQPSFKINAGQQYLWILAARFYTLQEPLSVYNVRQQQSGIYRELSSPLPFGRAALP